MILKSEKVIDHLYGYSSHSTGEAIPTEIMHRAFDPLALLRTDISAVASDRIRLIRC